MALKNGLQGGPFVLSEQNLTKFGRDDLWLGTPSWRKWQRLQN